MKTWGRTILAVLACMVALVGANGFWWLWGTESFDPGQPGEWITTEDGITFRLDGFHHATENASEFGPPALDGATFVAAEISVVMPADAHAAQCRLRLIGTGQDEWSDTGGLDASSYSLCDHALAAPGTAYTGIVQFEVPDAYLDQIRGVAIGHQTAGLSTTPLLTID